MCGAVRFPTYQELPRPPNPLNHPELVEPQHPEQHLRAVREHPPPRHDPPRLPVPPEMRHHRDGQVEAGVRQRGEEGSQHGAEDEGAGDGRVGEARGDHCRCACVVVEDDMVRCSRNVAGRVIARACLRGAVGDSDGGSNFGLVGGGTVGGARS